MKGIILLVMIGDHYNAQGVWYMARLFISIVFMLIVILVLAGCLLFRQFGIARFSCTGLLFGFPLEGLIRNLTVTPVTHIGLGRRGQWRSPFRSGVLKRGSYHRHGLREINRNGGGEPVLLPGQLSSLFGQFGGQYLFLR